MLWVVAWVAEDSTAAHTFGGDPATLGPGLDTSHPFAAQKA